MALISLNDLPMSVDLDRQAMTSIRGGGGAPWVLGAFRPYVAATPFASSAVGSVTNFYQVENNFYQIDKIVNQQQNVLLNNTGNNANLTVVSMGSFTG